ncbi:hypothetical protein R3I94_001461 [Phoxinus phoxinus]
MVQRLTPAVTRHPFCWSFESPFALQEFIFKLSSPYSSYPRSPGQDFMVRYCQVPNVPKDPKHQTKEDDDRSRKDKKVPKTDLCKNANEQENQSDNVEQNGQEEKDTAAAHSFLAVHLGDAQVRRADRRTAG